MAQPGRAARLEIAAAAPVIPWTDLVYGGGAERARVRRTRITLARAGDDAGRGREGDGRQRDLRRGAVRDRPRAADRRAVRPRAPDGLPGAGGHRPRGRRRRLGGAHRTPGEPYDDPTAQAIVDQLARFHSALLRRRQPPAAAALPRLGLHRRPVPGRRGAALREPHRASATPGSRSRCCSATSATSGPRTSRPSATRLLAAIQRLVRPPPAGAGARPARGRHRLRPDLSPRRRAARRRIARASFAAPRARQAAVPRAPTRRRSTPPAAIRGRRGDRPGHRRRRRLRRDRPPASAPGTASARLSGPRGAAALTLIGAPPSAPTSRRAAPRPTTPSSPRGSGTSRPTAEPAPRRPRALPARPTGANAGSFTRRPGGSSPGTRLELELLGNDPPYARPSNGAFEIEVCGLRVRLPVRERRPRR